MSDQVTRQLNLDLDDNRLDYTVRVSTRSRRMRLEVTPLGDVCVIIPKRVSPRHVPRFVAQNRAWLDATLDKLAQRRRRDPGLYEPLPKSIQLKALDQTWLVDYQPGAGRRLMRDNPHHRVVTLKAGSSGACRDLLRNWLQQQGRQHLVPWLHETSDEIGLPFNKVTIRGQKTRWGSCSTRHDISLNRNLLLLPPDLVRYLMIHELCHTVHLNHSRAYWSLVKRFEPDYRQRERALNEAAYSLPYWTYSRDTDASTS
jgi:predicted metal-dependent hydrolase